MSRRTAPEPQRVVVVRPRRKGYHSFLHLTLTILTGGLWLPVWMVTVARHKRQDEWTR